MAASESLSTFLANLDLSPSQQVKADAARRLAQAIDTVDDDRSLPPLVKELRATLDDLAPKVADDGDTDWTAAASGRGNLLSVVGDAAQPAAPDSRAPRRRGSAKAG